MTPLVLVLALAAAPPKTCPQDVVDRFAAVASSLERAEAEVAATVPKKKRARLSADLGEARRGLDDLRVRVGCTTAPTPQAGAPAGPPSGPTRSAVKTIDEASFSTFLAMAQAQDNDEQKTQLLEEVVGAQCVTTFQVQNTMALYKFDGEKLRAARFLVPRIVDRGSAGGLVQSFAFDGDKRKLLTMLKNARTDLQCVGGGG